MQNDKSRKKTAKFDNWRFLVTSSCNSRCFFCHGDGTGKKQGQFLKYCTYISLLEKYSGNIKKVRFAGGEPLLHPEIFKMVKAALKITPNVSVGTNGLLLGKYYRQIVESGLPKLTVSLHSRNPQTFSRITKISPNAFKSILSSISKLKNHLQVKINYVVLDGINNSKKEINDILSYVVENHFNIEFEELDLGSLQPIDYHRYHYQPEQLVKTIIEINNANFRYQTRESVWSSTISKSIIGVQKCHCFHSLCNNCLQSRPILVYPTGLINRCRLGEPKIKGLDISF